MRRGGDEGCTLRLVNCGILKSGWEPKRGEERRRGGKRRIRHERENISARFLLGRASDEEPTQPVRLTSAPGRRGRRVSGTKESRGVLTFYRPDTSAARLGEEVATLPLSDAGILEDGGREGRRRRRRCVWCYPVLVLGWAGGVGSTMTITGGGVGSDLCGRSRQEHC